jgi:molecular chaperone GrpE (heat shock protein)
MQDDPKSQSANQQSETELDQQSEENLEAFSLKEENDTLRLELEKEKNAKLMAMADLQNYRKRMEAEKAKFGVLSNMQLVMQILEVIDDIQLAMSDEQLDLERAKEMLKISQDKLLAGLVVAGLEKVEVKIGDKFDPAMMEAVTTVPVESEDKDNTIVAVISSAFRYAGQTDLVKTAKVVVGKYKA